MVREIDVNNSDRLKTYNFFKSFSNSTYSCNVTMNVTKLVEHVKAKQESFFIDMLYIVLKGLNSIDEMRMRLDGDKPVIYDDINPAYTVMTQSGNFENVRHKNCDNYRDFYKLAKENIERAKIQTELKKESYNPENCYDEYYITCVPWVNFSSFAHPIPDDKCSQCIPRICWGKYILNNNKYELTLNITVSHMFVDGYQLALAFTNIQELLDKANEILK